MKTALILNEMEEILYAVVDGDWSRFQGVFINSTLTDPQLEAELSELLYDEEGNRLIETCSLDDFVAAIRDGADAVELGILS